MSAMTPTRVKQCKWCGETYELLHARQRSHAQSDWCMQQQKKAKQHRVHAKRAALRQPKIKVRPSKIITVEKPIACAIYTARRLGGRYFHEHYRDDLEQEMALVLVGMGVLDIENPAPLDVCDLSRRVLRALYRMRIDMLGIKPRCEVQLIGGKALELAGASLARQWHAAWRAA